MRRNLLWFGLALLCACTQYKPNYSTGTRKVNEGGASGSLGQPSASGSEIVLANAKLSANPGPYQVKIDYAGGTKTLDFTPSGNESRLPLAGVSAGTAGVMTLEISSGNKLKFVVKKANVALSPSEASRVVIDDCLILPAPWEGKSNDGSCDWTIQEVNN